MMIAMISRELLVVLLLALPAAAQSTAPAEKPAPKAVAVAPPADQDVDPQALVKETEFMASRPHKMGVFWWVPVDFWQVAMKRQGFSPDETKKVFAPFANYNLFIVAVGDIDAGSASWFTESDIKKKLTLRDQHGNTYKPLQTTPDDLASVIDNMKPVLKNMMGSFGGGLQFIVFPARDNQGIVFADPRKGGEIALDVPDLMGIPNDTYTWKLPLSSLSPPKYCPIGKERVEANWKYCPWHGNRLEESHGPTPSDQAAKPEAATR
jgi:hypothetical protein